MKLIYDNYNKLYLSRNNGIDVIIKKFKNHWSYENELLANKLLSNNGFRVPNILKNLPQEITYELFNFTQLDSILKDDNLKFSKILEFHQNFVKQNMNGFKIFRDSEIKNQLLKISYELHSNNVLDNNDILRIKQRSKRFRIKEYSVIHGDFRTENIFIDNSTVALIDFEFTGLGDPNKDLAYLWIDCTKLNKDLNHLLRRAYENLTYYQHNQFDFWVVYFHIMVISNPKVTDKSSWLKNLRHILENKSAAPNIAYTQ